MTSLLSVGEITSTVHHSRDVTTHLFSEPVNCIQVCFCLFISMHGYGHLNLRNTHVLHLKENDCLDNSINTQILDIVYLSIYAYCDTLISEYSGLDNSGSLSGQPQLFHTLVWECYSNWAIEHEKHLGSL